MPVLMRLLEDTNSAVKVSAVSTLGKYGKDAVIAAPMLRQMLANQDSKSECRGDSIVGIGFRLI
jgi:hypothetical protein